MDPNICLHFTLLFITDFLGCLCGIVNRTSQSVISSQSDSIRPDLGCILFGNAGCSISCTVMCDMYGCYAFDPICMDELSCNCNETYQISSSITTTTDYNRLSFNKLWTHKINKSKISQKIRKKIFQYPETFDEILKILRDPHKTGLHVKRRLQDLHPNWTNVLKLEPKQLGYIDNLIEGEQFDDDGLKQYLENNMEPLVDEMYDQLQETKQKSKSGGGPDRVDEKEIKRLLSLAKSTNKKINSGTVTVYDTDQIILTSVMKKLLDITENNQTDGKRKKFTLGDEMTVGQEDLFDADFNVDDNTDAAKSFVLSDEMTVGKDDLYDDDFGRSIRSLSESESRRGLEQEYNVDKSSLKYQYDVNQASNQIAYNNNGFDYNNNNNNGYYSSYYDNYYNSVQGNGYFKESPPAPPNYVPGTFIQSNNYYTYNYQNPQDETRTESENTKDENYTEILDYLINHDDDTEMNSYNCCEGSSLSWSNENMRETETDSYNCCE